MMTNLRLFARVGALVLLMLTMIGAGSCPVDFNGMIFDKIFTKFQAQIEAEFGFTIHVLYPALPAGTVIVPDTPGGYTASATKLTCDGWCILAMLDLQPRAHFAHPVILMVYDLRSNQLQPLKSEWWPYNETTGERYFHTVEERRKTLLCRPPHNCFDFYPPDEPRWSVEYTVAPTTPPSGFLRPATPPPVWGIIVNGYDDEEDSFDEDTDGVYRVLKGMGIDDDHICYLTDSVSTDGRDSIARRETVKQALEYVTLMTGGELDDAIDESSVLSVGERVCGTPRGGRFIPRVAGTDVLLFYGSHGNFDEDTEVNKVLCNHFKDPGLGYITDLDFFEWLKPIKTKRMTVVIEACHSGGFIDDLSVLEHENLSIFVSSAKDKSSFGDVDPPTDKNPGDAGSESIWGFIEAFGTSSADALCETGGPCDDKEICTTTDACENCTDDGSISFGEAVCYAQYNDATPGDHESKSFFRQSNPPAGTYLGATTLLPTVLTVDPGPQSTCITSGADGLPLSLLKRNRFNNIELGITNTGAKRLGVATVRLHIEQQGETQIKDWDHAPTLILPNLAVDDLAELRINLRAGGDVDNEEMVTLTATIDSPQAPAEDHSATQKKKSPGQAVDRFGNGTPGGCRSTGGRS